jgi:hypothetical protein
MGLSTAGFAFKTTSFTPTEQEMIRRAFGSDSRLVPDSDPADSSDIRVPGVIAVESRHGSAFIYSDEFAGRVLFDRQPVSASFLSALGNPDTLLVFCHYDSGGSFGYLVIEGGVQTRYRLHLEGTTTYEGAPKDYEKAWLHAKEVVEESGEPPAFQNIETGEISSKEYVVARLLNDTLIRLFGGCPLDDWNYKTRLAKYRRDQHGSAAREPSAKRPWWKVW